MTLGPFLFRIARWPVETIDGLQSPLFAQAVDSWIADDEAIRIEGAALAEELYPLVPAIPDRTARARVLAMRRALHRDSNPVITPEDLCGPLAAKLREHADRRARHAGARVMLATQYESVLRAEQAALWQIASENEFKKALCLASPGTYEEFNRTPEQPNWRLIRTLFQYAVRAVGRATPNGLWAGVSTEPSACQYGIEVEQRPAAVRFAPRLRYLSQAFAAAAPDTPFPSIYEDSWEAISSAMQCLPETELSAWSTTIGELREICDAAAARFASFTPAEFHDVLTRARRVLNGLLRRYNLPLAGEADAVLAADFYAPFRIRISGTIRDQIADAVRQTWRFDRLGTGESDAQARRRREFAHESADHEPDLTSCWERELAPVFSERRHRLPNHGANSPMPPGSALMRLALSAGMPAIRLGSITPDPALFYARFHHLFLAEGSAEFFNWYRSELSRIEHLHAHLRFADLGLPSPSDLNAAARPRLAGTLVEPSKLKEPLISMDACGRPRLAVGDDPHWIVPLVSSAVSLHTSDPCTRKLATIFHLLGRPLLLRPLPTLDRERNEWLHLPRLELDEQTTIGVERWHLPPSFTSQLTSSQGFDRFAIWRSYVRDRGLPDLLFASSGLENTESLLPCASVLAIEVLARSIKGKPAELRLQEAFPDPRESWVTSSDGKHYLAEVAAAWVGDTDFWSSYSTPPAQ